MAGSNTRQKKGVKDPDGEEVVGANGRQASVIGLTDEQAVGRPVGEVEAPTSA